jgi:hypothetical protein
MSVMRHMNHRMLADAPVFGTLSLIAQRILPAGANRYLFQHESTDSNLLFGHLEQYPQCCAVSPDLLSSNALSSVPGETCIGWLVDVFSTGDIARFLLVWRNKQTGELCTTSMGRTRAGPHWHRINVQHVRNAIELRGEVTSDDWRGCVALLYLYYPKRSDSDNTPQFYDAYQMAFDFPLRPQEHLVFSGRFRGYRPRLPRGKPYSMPASCKPAARYVPPSPPRAVSPRAPSPRPPSAPTLSPTAPPFEPTEVAFSLSSQAVPEDAALQRSLDDLLTEPEVLELAESLGFALSPSSPHQRRTPSPIQPWMLARQQVPH